VNSTNSQYENLLQVIKAQIVLLMDHGGAAPLDTCDAVAEEAPEIFDCFEESYILELCREVQRWEVPVESARFQKMYAKFNSRYFAGQLQEYKVRVVYDVNFWVGKPPGNAIDGYFVPEGLRIFLRLSFDRRAMIRILVHEMVHVAAGPGHGARFISPIRFIGIGILPEHVKTPDISGVHTFGQQKVLSKDPF
jgi:hypothetical protein